MQRASRRADGLVVWDYHVIVIEVDAQAAAAVLVWDLDTWLPFPCTFRQYAQHALQADTITLDLEYQRWVLLLLKGRLNTHTHTCCTLSLMHMPDLPLP